MIRSNRSYSFLAFKKCYVYSDFSVNEVYILTSSFFSCRSLPSDPDCPLNWESRLYSCLSHRTTLTSFETDPQLPSSHLLLLCPGNQQTYSKNPKLYITTICIYLFIHVCFKCFHIECKFSLITRSQSLLCGL